MTETAVIPSNIKLHQNSHILEVEYGADEKYQLSCEYLRINSPSAEVRGHGPGQEVLQLGKENVNIKAIEPVGHYAVCLIFDDGHSTGIYSWDWLYHLCKNHDQIWQEYLAKLEKAGHQRKVTSN